MIARRPRQLTSSKKLSLEPFLFGVQSWLDSFVLYVGVALVGMVGSVLVAYLASRGLFELMAGAADVPRDGTGQGFRGLSPWTLAKIVGAMLSLTLASFLFIAIRATRDTPRPFQFAQIWRRLPSLGLALLVLLAPSILLTIASASLQASYPDDRVIIALIWCLLMVVASTATWFVVAAALVEEGSAWESMGHAFTTLRRCWLSVGLGVAAALAAWLVWFYSLAQVLLTGPSLHVRERLVAFVILFILQLAVTASLATVSSVQHYIRLRSDDDDSKVPHAGLNAETPAPVD